MCVEQALIQLDSELDNRRSVTQPTGLVAVVKTPYCCPKPERRSVRKRVPVVRKSVDSEVFFRKSPAIMWTMILYFSYAIK